MDDTARDAGDLIAPVDAPLHGAGIIAEIKKSGVKTVITLPDRTTADGLLRPIAADPGLRHVRVCKEDEAIGISAALSYCDHRALILIQYTGLLDSANAIRGIAVDYEMPICMMVGLNSKEPGVAPTKSKHYSIRVVEPVLDALEVEHFLIETDDDIGRIRPAIDAAYETSRPVAMLVGRRPIAP